MHAYPSAQPVCGVQVPSVGSGVQNPGPPSGVSVQRLPQRRLHWPNAPPHGSPLPGGTTHALRALRWPNAINPTRWVPLPAARFTNVSPRLHAVAADAEWSRGRTQATKARLAEQVAGARASLGAAAFQHPVTDGIRAHIWRGGPFPVGTLGRIVVRVPPFQPAGVGRSTIRAQVFLLDRRQLRHHGEAWLHELWVEHHPSHLHLPIKVRGPGTCPLGHARCRLVWRRVGVDTGSGM